MEGGGAEAGGVVPGDGGGEGVVDLEGAGAVLEAVELAAVGFGEAAGRREGEELARGDVQEDEIAGGEVGEGVDAGVGGDASAEMGEVGGEGVGEGLCAASRDGPADGVGCGSEDEAEGGAQGAVERHEGVCGEAGEESFGLRCVEVAAG